MKNILLLVAVVLMGQSSLASDYSSYRLPITRNGVTENMLAYNFWSGEYPTPVVHVRKDMTVDAYASLRQLTKKVKCDIKKGLYNPWSSTKNSADTYYSIVPVHTYVAQKDVEIEEMIIPNSDGTWKTISKLKKGDTVTNVIYGGENWCSGEMIAVGTSKKQYVEFWCPSIEENSGLKEVNKPKHKEVYEQWVYLACENGEKAFIKDETLLSLPNVEEGSIADLPNPY